MNLRKCLACFTIDQKKADFEWSDIEEQNFAFETIEMRAYINHRSKINIIKIKLINRIHQYSE